MISRTGPFIIEEYHLRGATELIREVYPHPVLGRTFLLWFSKYLDTAFITMDISAFQKFFFHQLIQWFQVSVCTVYDPVCHSLCGKIKIISGKLSFLACQRHPIYIFSVHDTGDKGRRSDTSTDQGRFFFRTFHGPAFRTAVYISDLFFNLKLCRYKTQAFYGFLCYYAVFFSAFRAVTGFPFQFIGPGLNSLKIGKIFFLLSFSLFTFIRGWPDLFKQLFCFRIRTGFCLIEQVHLFIAFGILFTGCTKLFPLCKGKTVREHGI